MGPRGDPTAVVDPKLKVFVEKCTRIQIYNKYSCVMYMTHARQFIIYEFVCNAGDRHSRIASGRWFHHARDYIGAHKHTYLYDCRKAGRHDQRRMGILGQIMILMKNFNEQYCINEEFSIDINFKSIKTSKSRYITKVNI